MVPPCGKCRGFVLRRWSVDSWSVDLGAACLHYLAPARVLAPDEIAEGIGAHKMLDHAECCEFLHDPLGLHHLADRIVQDPDAFLRRTGLRYKADPYSNTKTKKSLHIERLCDLKCQHAPQIGAFNQP